MRRTPAEDILWQYIVTPASDTKDADRVRKWTKQKYEDNNFIFFSIRPIFENILINKAKNQENIQRQYYDIRNKKKKFGYNHFICLKLKPRIL